MKPSLRFPKSTLSCAVAAVAVAATVVLASTAAVAADSGAARAEAEAVGRITVEGCAPPGGHVAAGHIGAEPMNPIPIEVDDVRFVTVAATDAPAVDVGDVGDAGEALKRAYLACEAEAMNRVLDTGSAMRCSQIYEALLHGVFGGRYEDLHAWSKGAFDAP